MKNINYYTETSQLKSKADFKTEIFTEHDFENFVGTRAQIDAKEKELNQLVQDTYTLHRKNRNQEIYAKQQEFKDDLFKYHGVIHNPKAEKCYSLAWEHGHSDGLQQVQYYFEEFVELIQE